MQWSWYFFQEQVTDKAPTQEKIPHVPEKNLLSCQMKLHL